MKKLFIPLCVVVLVVLMLATYCGSQNSRKHAQCVCAHCHRAVYDVTAGIFCNLWAACGSPFLFPLNIPNKRLERADAVEPVFIYYYGEFAIIK